MNTRPRTTMNAWQAYSVAAADAERLTRSTVDVVHHQVESTITTTELVLDELVEHVEEYLRQNQDLNHGVSDDAHLFYMALLSRIGIWLFVGQALCQAPNALQ